MTLTGDRTTGAAMPCDTPKNLGKRSIQVEKLLETTLSGEPLPGGPGKRLLNFGYARRQNESIQVKSGL